MLDPRAAIIADPPVRAHEWDLGRVIHRHQQCLAMAEHALENAGPDADRRTLAASRAFHRRRADVLAERFEKATTGYLAPV